jgi:hypothetical protein
LDASLPEPPAAARRTPAVRAALAASGLVLARLANPDRPLPFEVCAFKLLTGLPCPTCGLTRALCHALRADWAASLTYHPAGIPLAACLIGWIGWSAFEAARGRPLGGALRDRLATPLVTAGAVASFVCWIVRLGGASY